ncbi:hypothetical protein [Pseudolactococcus reticulitermitis]|uniref:Uncharacterized protein n=1 Tax=Pseudolactococcus reticulitermitis TaxID=2025039 RepID=A0A224XEN0_9LACT|nr:hypothetical protein [Lactococcus reticulitermitis]GAX48085.1 hypothetical protein RsY01_1699 [Lactococcus reticulitermitis]
MAYHTYEFLKRRKNEPKWAVAYHKALMNRILSAIISIIIILLVILVYLYIDRNNVDVQYYFEICKEKISNIIENIKN